jgi:hypothetical protein
MSKLLINPAARYRNKVSEAASRAVDGFVEPALTISAGFPFARLAVEFAGRILAVPFSY